MTALRVGVNLLWCVPGEVGGSEQYLVRQLAGVQEAARASGTALELVAYATTAFRAAHGDELGAAAFVEAPHSGSSRPRRVLDENTWLHARTGAMDLVHHGGGTAPRRARRPYLLTIHDLQYRTFPRHFSSLKRRYLDAVVPGSARRAALIAVPSEYVRGSVVAELGVPSERVVVVPHGYEPSLLVERTPEDELRRRFGLGDGRVLLYPAMTAPHKRHTFLVELMRHHWLDPDLRLVLIGNRGLADDEVSTAIAAAPPAVRDRIVRPGRVSDADRNGLVAMAEALVFPSEYEGFGAPVIEAMALGTPVVCSDATCLPDVVAGAAVVRPLDADQWAGALDEVAHRRADLIAAGRARAAGFTALESGRALLAAYLRAAA